MGIFVFSACSNPALRVVDELNERSYDFHYRSLDSTRVYAEQALSLAGDYDAGRAEALNNLAFCTIADVKSYRPETNSISSGQVLQEATECSTARLITWEMADMLALDLLGKRLVTDQLTLTIGYDVKNLQNEDTRRSYEGKVVLDHYGRAVPAHAHGTVNLGAPVSSSKLITEAMMELFDRIADCRLLVRRITVNANRVVPESSVREEVIQLDFFSDPVENEKIRLQEQAELRREKNLQLAMLRMKERYGKNAVLRGSNLCDGATAMSRNRQIGGHRA